MRNRKPKPPKKQIPQLENTIQPSVKKSRGFHLEFLNAAQRSIWSDLEKNDIIFLLGSAGTGKTFIATAYSIYSFLRKETSKIMISRPIVEAGEKLGFLPGPQPLTAKVLTANGWTTMGQIKFGDRVIGRDGMPTEVVGIYPKGKKDTYKVTTTDGTSTECCLDHLWYTHTAEDKKRNRNGSVKSTKQILETLKTNNGKINHFLPRNEAVHYDKKELPLSPYVFLTIFLFQIQIKN
jgi:phosphate starvation-inducible PhoH-like protein